MIAVHVFIPQPAFVFALDPFQPNRTHFGQLPEQRCPGIGSGRRHGPAGLIGAPARPPPLAWQPEQALILPLLQDIQARRYFVRPRSRHPPPVLTNRARQLQAAQPRTQPDCLPGRLQILGRYSAPTSSGTPYLFCWHPQHVRFFHTTWKRRYCLRGQFRCLALFATKFFPSHRKNPARIASANSCVSAAKTTSPKCHLCITTTFPYLRPLPRNCTTRFWRSAGVS
jgi:hypothetical protein